jgi:hypothetical protein
LYVFDLFAPASRSLVTSWKMGGLIVFRVDMRWREVESCWQELWKFQGECFEEISILLECRSGNLSGNVVGSSSDRLIKSGMFIVWHM